MSNTYVIGDVQGCFRSFRALLNHVGFNAARDELWLVGDVVNRGPDSLATLRWLFEHQQSVRVVLGNHDFALLAMAWGLRKPKALDTLAEVLAAPDCDELLGWLRTRPLVYENERFVMLHAGVTPSYSLEDTRTLARAIERELSDEARAYALVASALCKEPSSDARIAELARGLRMLVNLRAVDASGAADYTFKGPPRALGEGRSPWFAHLTAEKWPKHLVTGHWAALGLLRTERLTALDTGCVWGGALSALCLETDKVVDVPTQELSPLTPDED